jgi:UDP-N-acetylglucosamine enolpyruvyl transferase
VHQGGVRLCGEVSVSGGKTAGFRDHSGRAFGAFPCTIEYLPDIDDVRS